MPKLICTVTNDLTYDQRMIRICSSLARAGYEVLLVGRQRRTSRPPRNEAFEQKRLYCHFEKGKLFYLEYNLRLLFFLFFRPFDAVCSVDLDTILPGFLACKIRGKTCIYDAHEYFTEVPEVIRRPAIKRLWEAVARLTIPRVKYAYTVGPCLAELLEQRYGTPFIAIRNVPATRNEEMGPASKLEKPVILYQGALNEGRGLEQAITAMKEVEGTELWLAGEGDLSEPLREQAKREGLEEKVRFLGYLLPHELSTLTTRAYIGLNLLDHKGLSYYYSQANKAFDYIQAGVPSINMAFPEYKALNESYQCFLLLEKPEISAIRSAIKLLLAQDGPYEQLKANCLKAAVELNWEKEEQRLLSFYEDILPLGNGQ